MGNDCENCGAQIPYGISECEACEMGITEENQSNRDLLNSIYDRLDNLDSKLRVFRATKNLIKQVLDEIRDIKADIRS